MERKWGRRRVAANLKGGPQTSWGSVPWRRGAILGEKGGVRWRSGGGGTTRRGRLQALACGPAVSVARSGQAAVWAVRERKRPAASRAGARGEELGRVLLGRVREEAGRVLLGHGREEAGRVLLGRGREERVGWAQEKGEVRWD